MRVDDNFTASSDLRSLQVERSPETQLERQNQQSKQERTGDSVSLSSVGTEISRALAGDSPQEISRVERAQEAVAAGSLNVSSEELADSLIDSALTETSFDRQAAAVR